MAATDDATPLVECTCGEPVLPGQPCAVIRNIGVMHIKCVICAHCNEAIHDRSYFTINGDIFHGICGQCQTCHIHVPQELEKMFAPFFTTRPGANGARLLHHATCIGCECDVCMKKKNAGKYASVGRWSLEILCTSDPHRIYDSVRHFERCYDGVVLNPCHRQCSLCTEPLDDAGMSIINASAANANPRHSMCDICGDCVTKLSTATCIIDKNIHGVEMARKYYHKDCMKCTTCTTKRITRAISSGRSFISLETGWHHNDCILCVVCNTTKKGCYGRLRPHPTLGGLQFIHDTCPNAAKRKREAETGVKYEHIKPKETRRRMNYHNPL